MAMANNADWYCEECQAWGIAFSRNAQRWLSRAQMPPYHSNLLWFDESDPSVQIAELDNELAGPWSIKDATGRHDLTDCGFDVLFHAEWFIGQYESPSPVNVTVVDSEDGFARWLDVWGETPEDRQVFTPAFWSSPDVHFLYAEQNGEVLGGLACNESTHVYGVTNFFGPFDAVSACLSKVNSFGKPLVGYERGEALEHLVGLGFRTTGPLIVWIKTT